VVLDKIDKTVQEANAPLIAVTVDEGNMGTASPRGTLTDVKLGIPFTLNYAAKNEYPFTGWQAMVEGSGEILSLWTPDRTVNSDKIRWEPVNLTGTEIRVTILVEPAMDAVIVIGPYGFTWPYLKVEVDEDGMGTAYPRGILTGIKQDISFTLDYAAKDEYPFTGWQARLEGDETLMAWWKPGTGAESADPGGLRISWEPQNAVGTRIQITIQNNPGKRIFIGPYGASLPFVNVEIDEARQGIANPRGALTGIKRGIPFSLNYSTFSEYGFLSWEAVLASAPNNPLGPEDVEFSPQNEMSTMVRVSKDPGDDRIIIRPVGALKPRVMAVTPVIDDGVVYLFRSIRIRFDRAMDPASFLFDNGLAVEGVGDWRALYHAKPGGTLADFYDHRVYKNILIESSVPYTQNGTSSNNWAPFYDPPELSADGTILDIPFRYNTFMSYGKNDLASAPGMLDLMSATKALTVTLNRDIKDTRGYSLGEAYTFFVETGLMKEFAEPDSDAVLPYPKLSINRNSVIVRASPPDQDHPDGQIWPGAPFFSTGKRENEYRDAENNWHPVDDPRYHFSYSADEDYWVYIAFQPEYMDYPFTGALVYESHEKNGRDRVINYTGEIAVPVHDPDIIKTLTAQLATYSSRYTYTPSRPVRVVRYQMVPRREPDSKSAVRVTVQGVLLSMLDAPKDALPQDEIATNFDYGRLLEGGGSKYKDRMTSDTLEFPVWYYKTD
jgi:hypothetical protein